MDNNFLGFGLTQEEFLEATLIRYRAICKRIAQYEKEKRNRLWGNKKRWQYSKSRKHLHNGRLSKRK